MEVLAETTVRYLTPIFGYTWLIDSDNCFKHSGDHKGAKYSISIKKYGSRPLSETFSQDELDELSGYDPNNTFKNIISIFHNNKFAGFQGGNVLLILEVIQPISEEENSAWNGIANEIQRSIIEALGLHISNGLKYEYSYMFCSQSVSPFDCIAVSSGSVETDVLFGATTSKPHTTPYLFSPLMRGLSVLKNNQYNDCRKTFNILLEKEWDDQNSLDKVLQLAIDYKQTAPCLTNDEHGFLILIVAIEALFKKDYREDASFASDRIAKLISSGRKDKKSISREFCKGETAFFKIRNDIAHGSLDLNMEIVTIKYSLLYQHLTKAIVALLHLPNGTIGNLYYDDLTTYVNQKYNENI